MPNPYIQTDEIGNPTALIAPIISLQKEKEGRTISVDLIGAVHFADAEYYEKINSIFKNYQVVLVEMVAPKGTSLAAIAASRNSKSSKKFSWIGTFEKLQKGMGRALGFTNQLDAVDYSAPNLLLADIDAETLFQRMAENKELSKFTQDRISDICTQEEIEDDGIREPELTLTAFLLSKEKTLLMKRFFAVELARNLEEETTPFQQSLIRERNTILLSALDNQIALNKCHIAVFFGIAHLPDLKERLEISGFRTVKTDRLTAWKL